MIIFFTFCGYSKNGYSTTWHFKVQNAGMIVVLSLCIWQCGNNLLFFAANFAVFIDSKYRN